ncbi:MAG: FecR family protein [Deltaproteobacteria bacterium]|nr:FecR family protein [Deltaproteobacteria bacterium]
MSKPIRRFLSFLLVLQLIIPYSTFAAAVGEFTSVVGNVTQTRAKELITPVVKSPIEMKDLIATARTSSATMVFPDDSTITLSENTKLEIKEFLFKDQSRRAFFSLPIGKLTANVQKFIGGDNVFEVNSPTVGIGVRGTGFEFVEALKDDKVDSTAENQRMATVSCTDGSLNLSAFSDTGAVISTATLEAGQMAVIIGGVITISAIAAAMTAAIGAAGGTGTGTGGAAAGGAAAATGMSTAAIAGIAIGGAAVIGGAAALAGGGGGSSGTTPPTTSCSNTDGRWSGPFSGTACGVSDSGTWVMTCSRCSCPGTWTSNRGSSAVTCTISDNRISCNVNGFGCTGNPCQLNASGTISGNSVSGTYGGGNCDATGSWTGNRNGSVTVRW